MNVLDKCYIGIGNWIRREKETFFSDERGVSGFVAAIMLVIVAIVVGIAFKDQIAAAISKLWGKVDDNINGI